DGRIRVIERGLHVLLVDALVGPDGGGRRLEPLPRMLSGRHVVAADEGQPKTVVLYLRLHELNRSSGIDVSLGGHVIAWVQSVEVEIRSDSQVFAAIEVPGFSATSTAVELERVVNVFKGAGDVALLHEGFSKLLMGLRQTWIQVQRLGEIRFGSRGIHAQPRHAPI